MPINCLETRTGQENEARNMEHGNNPRNLPGFDHLLKQICTQMIKAELLGLKEARRLLSQTEDDLVKIRKLCLKFLAR